MIRRRIYRGLFCLLAMACLVAVCRYTADAANTEKSCRVTILPGGDAYAEDLATADVVVDLYPVADAAGGYGYRLQEAYQNLQITENMDNSHWRALAQQAAAIAMDGQTPIVKDGPVGKDTVISRSDQGEALRPGLYLVLAHSRDLREPGDYTLELKETTDSGEEGTGSVLATRAHSALYDYGFQPELLAIPTVLRGTGGGTDGWIYDPTITLKPRQMPRMGDLEITKTLASFVGTEPATFVFRVEAVYEDPDTGRSEKVFSDVVAMSFTAEGEKSKLLKGEIPVGAKVTVTEVYSGSHYELTDEGDSREVVIEAENAVKAAFSNDYDGTITGGHGVVNCYTYDGENWQVEQRTRENAEN